MKKLIFLIVLYTGFFISAQNTSTTYFEDFSGNYNHDWVYYADGTVEVNNGTFEMNAVSSTYIDLFPPVGGSTGDYSVKISGGTNADGGIGRIGFKALTGLYFDEDSLYVVYSENYMSQAEPHLTTLHSIAAPDNFGSMRLDVVQNGNSLILSGWYDETKFYEGEIVNADPGLSEGIIMVKLYSRMPDMNIQLVLDEVEIKYNPASTAVAGFTEEFNDNVSSVYLWGDESFLIDSVNVGSGSLNIAHSGEDYVAAYITAPVGTVTEFSAEMEAVFPAAHTSSMQIARILDFRNYIGFYMENETAYIAYESESDNDEFVILAQTDVTNVIVSKVEFSGEAEGNGYKFEAKVNGEVLLEANYPNIPARLKKGQIVYSFYGDSFSGSTSVVTNIKNINVDYVTDITTSLPETENILPAEFMLSQNYPNPFNPATVISFSLPQASNVKLDVFSFTGEKVASLVNGEFNEGAHSVNFDGNGLASGTYFYRLVTNEGVMVKKMLLLK